MKQKILSILFILLIPFAGFPQNKVSITVAADGSSRDNAISSALYSAIEQSYNSFVSSSTPVLKNNAIVNEMKKTRCYSPKIVENYKEIYVVQLSNNKWYALLSATVNVDELAAYIKKKGIKASVSMGTFDANVRKYRFDKIAEKTVIQNTICQILTMPNLYDYELKLEEPKLGNDWCNIEGSVSTKINENTQKAKKMLESAVLSVCVRDPNVYKAKDIDIWPFLGPSGEIIYLRNSNAELASSFMFRTHCLVDASVIFCVWENQDYDMQYFSWYVWYENYDQKSDGFIHFNNIFWIPAYFGYQIVDKKLGHTKRIKDHCAQGKEKYHFCDLNRDIPNYEFSIRIELSLEESKNYTDFIVKSRSYKLSDVINNKRVYLYGLTEVK